MFYFDLIETFDIETQKILKIWKIWALEETLEKIYIAATCVFPSMVGAVCLRGSPADLNKCAILLRRSVTFFRALGEAAEVDVTDSLQENVEMNLSAGGARPGANRQS